jgi:hypothetical protein
MISRVTYLFVKKADTSVFVFINAGVFKACVFVSFEIIYRTVYVVSYLPLHLLLSLVFCWTNYVVHNRAYIMLFSDDLISLIL